MSAVELLRSVATHQRALQSTAKAIQAEVSKGAAHRLDDLVALTRGTAAERTRLATTGHQLYPSQYQFSHGPAGEAMSYLGDAHAGLRGAVSEVGLRPSTAHRQLVAAGRSVEEALRGVREMRSDAIRAVHLERLRG